MPTNALQLAFIADRNVLTGLQVTLGSALSRIPAAVPVTAHIACDHREAEDYARIPGLSQRCHPNCDIRFYPFDFDRLFPFRRALKTRANYALFTFPEYLVGRVLYLDCDLLVTIDLNKLFSLPLDGNVAAAVSWEALANSADKGLYIDLGLPLDRPHFNAGVMLIDCDQWKKHHIAEKCVALRSKYDDILVGGNQPIINAVLSGMVVPLDRRWNTCVSAHRLLSSQQKNQARVWHLIGRPKPWDPLGEYVHCLGALWAAERRRLGVVPTRRGGIAYACFCVARYLPRYLKCMGARVRERVI